MTTMTPDEIGEITALLADLEPAVAQKIAALFSRVYGDLAAGRRGRDTLVRLLKEEESNMSLGNKPVTRRPVQVEFKSDKTRTIGFWAEEEIAQEMNTYGILNRSQPLSDLFYLRVDPRYDFYEVLAYLAELGGMAAVGEANQRKGVVA